MIVTDPVEDECDVLYLMVSQLLQAGDVDINPKTVQFYDLFTFGSIYFCDHGMQRISIKLDYGIIFVVKFI